MDFSEKKKKNHSVVIVGCKTERKIITSYRREEVFQVKESSINPKLTIIKHVVERGSSGLPNDGGIPKVKGIFKAYPTLCLYYTISSIETCREFIYS